MSFDIALTGLKAVNTQLTTISNNIANVATVGFKSSRVDFGSLYADTQAMGVEVLGTTQSISQGGALTATNRSLDLAISGGGFFVTRATNGDISYTRAGMFGMDVNNYIVNNQGHRLQGYLADAQGNLQTGLIGDLRLSSSNLPAVASENVDFVANLDANKPALDPAAVPPPPAFDPGNPASYHSTYTTEVFDSLGRTHVLTQYFVKRDDNEWEVYYTFDGNVLAGAEHTLQFNPNGTIVDNDAITQHTLNLAVGGGADNIELDLNYAGMTQTGSEFVVTTNRADGHPPGQYTGIAVEHDGTVYATYSNGERLLQGQVVLATFPNPEGLRNVTGTAWVETAASGAALVGAPGAGQYGSINAGNLENSNVDLTQQLVGLMEGQRNYQANTKVLATQKELTQVLFGAI